MLVRDPYYLSLHPAEDDARGTVLILHGGGWHGGLGQGADDVMRASIDALADWGFDVANLGYRGGARSLVDARSATEFLRRRLGEAEPLCAYGTSAGAQLALMVAARGGAGLDCVVSLLGPPNLEDFGTRPKSQSGKRLAREAFGSDRLAALSPINNTARIQRPVLIGATPCDAFTGLADQRELARRLEESNDASRLAVIAPGNDVDLEHCSVDRKSFTRFQATTREFLNAVAPARQVVDPAPTDDDSGVPWAAVLGAIGLAGGVLLLVYALRR